jgi:hypothetical protein
MDPERAAKYFTPDPVLPPAWYRTLKWKRWTLGLGILAVLAVIGGDKSSGAATAFITLFVIVIIGAVTVSWMRRRRVVAKWKREIAGAVTDNEFDVDQAEITEQAKAQSWDKLGIVPEQVDLIEPVVLEAPQFHLGPGARGKDGKVRAAVKEVIILYFSDSQVFQYRRVVDVRNPLGARDFTTEYFYRDVNGIETSSETVSVDTDEGPANTTLDVVTLKIAGGHDYTVKAYSNPEFATSIRGMRTLIQQKRESVT